MLLTDLADHSYGVDNLKYIIYYCSFFILTRFSFSKSILNAISKEINRLQLILSHARRIWMPLLVTSPPKDINPFHNKSHCVSSVNKKTEKVSLQKAGGKMS